MRPGIPGTSAARTPQRQRELLSAAEFAEAERRCFGFGGAEKEAEA